MFPDVRIKQKERDTTELFGNLAIGEFYVYDIKNTDGTVYIKTGRSNSLAIYTVERKPALLPVMDNPAVYPVKAQITIEI